jgi:hypothetical protein
VTDLPSLGRTLEEEIVRLVEIKMARKYGSRFTTALVDQCLFVDVDSARYPVGYNLKIANMTELGEWMDAIKKWR